MQKICIKCKQIKNVDEFHWRNKKLKIKQKHCKDCARNYKQNAYNKRKNHYKQLSSKNAAIAKERNFRKIIEFYSKNHCVDCGESDPIVLEFDHQNDKKCDVSTLLMDCWTWGPIKEEIDKCVVRCANCHRRKTAEESNWLIYRLMNETVPNEQNEQEARTFSN